MWLARFRLKRILVHYHVGKQLMPRLPILCVRKKLDCRYLSSVPFHPNVILRMIKHIEQYYSFHKHVLSLVNNFPFTKLETT